MVGCIQSGATKANKAIKIGDGNAMETTLGFHAVNLNRNSCPDKHCRPYPYMNPIYKKNLKYSKCLLQNHYIK